MLSARNVLHGSIIERGGERTRGRDQVGREMWDCFVKKQSVVQKGRSVAPEASNAGGEECSNTGKNISTTVRERAVR